MVAAERSKSLTTGNVRCGVAAVHEVLGSLALETPVNCHSELMEDSLRNIEPKDKILTVIKAKLGLSIQLESSDLGSVPYGRFQASIFRCS